MMIKAEVLDRRNLTPREGEILALICEGAVDKVIARQLAISIKTLEAHITHIYAKLQVREASINSRCATIALAVSRGMVRLSSTALCLWLMASAAGLDSPAVRVGRVGGCRPPLVRVRDREA